MGLLDDAIREHLELKRRHGADSAEVARQEREILGGGVPGAEAPEAAYAEAAPAAGVYDEPVAYEDAAPEYMAPEVDVPIAEAPVAAPQAPAPLAPLTPSDDIFPGTHELLAAGTEGTPNPAPAPSADATPAPALRPPAPADADSETAARSGARRLSDEELAAWRKRLSERADRLAAQRPGTTGGGPATAAGAAGAAPTPPAPAGGNEPPAYWSGNTSAADGGTPPALDTPTGAPAPAARPQGDPGVPADFFDAGDADTAFAPEPAPEPAEDPDHDVLDDTPDFLQETPEHDRMWFEQKPPRDFDFG